MSTDEKHDVASREWLTFADMQAMGIVPNWNTMSEWQRDYGFPVGRLFGPNSRRWHRHTEIDPWLASRPVARTEFEGVSPSPTTKVKRRTLIGEYATQQAAMAAIPSTKQSNTGEAK